MEDFDIYADLPSFNAEGHENKDEEVSSKVRQLLTIHSYQLHFI